jgi:hypothetical protein
MLQTPATCGEWAMRPLRMLACSAAAEAALHGLPTLLRALHFRLPFLALVVLVVPAHGAVDHGIITELVLVVVRLLIRLSMLLLLTLLLLTLLLPLPFVKMLAPASMAGAGSPATTPVGAAAPADVIIV